MDYALTTEQKIAWSKWLEEHAPRGVWTRIATALAKVDGAPQASWKTRLSEFKAGDEGELRAILEHAQRCGIVARELHLTSEELSTQLQRVKSMLVTDSHETVRIPGFEDYGSLPAIAAYFPLPLLKCINSPGDSDPKGSSLASPWRVMPLLVAGPSTQNRTGGRVDLDEIVTRASSSVHKPLLILIDGEIGMGKYLLLAAVIARLMQQNIKAAFWKGNPAPDVKVMACDGLDLLEPGERARLQKWIETCQGTLIATVSSDDACLDLTTAGRAIYTVCRGDSEWIQDYLKHLAQLASTHWQRPLDFGPLIRWLESDPVAAIRAGRGDLLGLMARAIADGRGTKSNNHQFVPLHLMPKLAIERYSSRLRLLGRQEEASFIACCGTGLLETIGQKLCQESRLSLTELEVAQACLSAASPFCLPGSPGNERADTQETSPTIFRYMQALFDAGLLFRRGAEARLTLPLVTAALGQALARAPRPEDWELWSPVVRNPIWHDVLISATEILGDGTLLLEALIHAPTAWALQAAQAITRLLSCPLKFSNPQTLLTAFRQTAWWWSRWPTRPEASTFTVIFGLPPMPSGPPQEHADRVAGTPPLVMLSRASWVHRDSLPSEITLQMISDDAQIPVERRWYLEALLGVRTTAHLEWLPVLVAPCQSPGLYEPRFWEWLEQALQKEDQLPPDFRGGGVAKWWLSVAAPFLAQSERGRAVLAGLTPNISICTIIRVGNGIGARFWREALEELVKKRTPSTVQVAAEAFAFVMEFGGTWNEVALRSLWDSSPWLQARLCTPLAQYLLKGERPFNPVDRPWVTWVLKHALEADSLPSLWARWVDLFERAAPWRPMLDAGLPGALIVEWALSYVPERNFLDRIKVQQGELALVDAELALTELVKRGDISSLRKILIEADSHWQNEAYKKVLTLEGTAARQTRLELALAHPQRLWRLLDELWPQPEDAELWERVIQASQSSDERMIRILIWAIRSDSSEAWVSGVGALARLAEQANELSLSLTNSPHQQALDDSETKNLVDQLNALAGWLASLGDVLTHAPVTRAAQIKAYLNIVLQQPLMLSQLRPAPSFWGICLRELGAEVVCDALVRANSYFGAQSAARSLDDAQPDGMDALKPIPSTNQQIDNTHHRLNAIVEFQDGVNVLLTLLHEPSIALPAAQVLCGRLLPTRADLLVQGLEERSLIRDATDEQAGTDMVTQTLLVGLLNRDPALALAWLEPRVKPLPAEVRVAWWRWLLPAFHGKALEPLVLAHYLEARREVERTNLV